MCGVRSHLNALKPIGRQHMSHSVDNSGIAPLDSDRTPADREKRRPQHVVVETPQEDIKVWNQCEEGYQRADCSYANVCPGDCGGNGRCVMPPAR